MTVWFTGAGPGDPELLTVKATRLLCEARCCIWAGSLVNRELLKLLPKDCAVHDSAGMTLEQIVAVMQEHHAQGHDVVRLHTGDPSLFGAIAEQMRKLRGLGIPYEVVPGVSSFQAAAAALTAELTLPEVSQAVLLTRVEGRTPVPQGQDLETLARGRPTLCLFLSAAQLEDVCRRLAPIYGNECPAALVYKASWPEQSVTRGTLASLPGLVTGIDRTALILVGAALSQEGAESRLYDPGFGHACREASE